MLITPNDATKLVVASRVMPYVVSGTVLGVGSGSTVNAFISLLAPVRHKVKRQWPRPRPQRLRFAMQE